MNLSADLRRIENALGLDNLTPKQAKEFFKAIAVTTALIWQSSDEEQLENDHTDILTDGLAVLMYIMG